MSARGGTARPLTVARAALLESGSDGDFREFLHSFMVFARCLEGVRDCLAKHVGVTAPQYEILSHLRERRGDTGLTITAIAERLHCTGSFATTEVGKLQRQGLVHKKRDLEDARRLFVTITANCERQFRRIAPFQRQLNDTLFESISASDFKRLHKLFPALALDGDRALALAAAIGSSYERSLAG
jgi:MarR family transcriptional regulator, organic hydroperoxide resistance regulator